MIRNRGSVPMAENMSAYLATCSADFLDCPAFIFRYLQNYRSLSSGGKPALHDTLLPRVPVLVSPFFARYKGGGFDSCGACENASNGVFPVLVMQTQMRT